MLRILAFVSLFSAFTASGSAASVFGFEPETIATELATPSILNHIQFDAQSGKASCSLTPELDTGLLADVTAAASCLFAEHFEARHQSQKQIKKFAQLGVLFTQNLSHENLSYELKKILSIYFVWLYLHDDYVTEMSKIHDANLAEVLRSMNTAIIAAFEGRPYVRRMDHESAKTLSTLFPAVDYLAQRLAPYRSSLTQFYKYLRVYLEGLTEQIEFAPTTPESFIVRHRKTGACMPSFFLLISLAFAQNGISLEGEFVDEKRGYLINLLNQADLVTLKFNESVSAKDAGDPEESYVATIINNALGKDRLDLSEVKNHGLILEKYGPSELGFSAFKRLSLEIEQDSVVLTRLIKDSASFLDQKTYELLANSVLKCVFGYALLNPMSNRYGKSFKVYSGVLTDSYSDFQKHFKSLISDKNK